MSRSNWSVDSEGQIKESVEHTARIAPETSQHEKILDAGGQARTGGRRDGRTRAQSKMLIKRKDVRKGTNFAEIIQVK